MKEDVFKIKTRAKGKFAQNLLTLGIGTAIAQSIPIIASPLLTRLFTPLDFGVFASFTAIMAILLVFYSGKYELSIILPIRHEDAINILSLCLIIIFLLSFVFEGIALLFGEKILQLLKYEEIGAWLWLVPLAAIFASSYNALNEWYIRKGNYLGLSKNKIGNTSGITIGSLIFGVLKLKPGLVFGQIAGQIFSVFMALGRFIKEDKSLFRFISLSKIKYFSVKYINFAKFNIPGQLINTIAGQLPIFVLTSRFGLAEAGLFAFTDRILGVPLNFIGNSFKDVFKQRAAADFKEKGNCLDIYKKVTYSLIGFSIIPFVLLFLTAPMLFSFIFGDEWFQAGLYARILCVMYMVSFVSMPTGWVFVITENQKLDLVWQVIFFALTVISLIIGVILQDALLTILSLGIGRTLSYMVQIFLTYKLAKGKT